MLADWQIHQQTSPGPAKFVSNRMFSKYENLYLVTFDDFKHTNALTKFITAKHISTRVIKW